MVFCSHSEGIKFIAFYICTNLISLVITVVGCFVGYNFVHDKIYIISTDPIFTYVCSSGTFLICFLAVILTHVAFHCRFICTCNLRNRFKSVSPDCLSAMQGKAGVCKVANRQDEVTGGWQRSPPGSHTPTHTPTHTHTHTHTDTHTHTHTRTPTHTHTHTQLPQLTMPSWAAVRMKFIYFEYLEPPAFVDDNPRLVVCALCMTKCQRLESG